MPPLEGTRRLAVGLASSAFRILRNHPGKTLAIAGFAVMAASIVGNAVLFQSGRHPAPLFGHAARPQALSAPQADAEPVQRPVVASVPPLPRDIAPPPVSAVAPKLATAKAATASRKVDGITQLLRSGDKTAASSTEIEPHVEPHVMSAQRALAKLGFPVKPDGRMGPSTKKALEKFGRDHHVDGGGDLSPNLMRALAGAARLPPG